MASAEVKCADDFVNCVDDFVNYDDISICLIESQFPISKLPYVTMHMQSPFTFFLSKFQFPFFLLQFKQRNHCSSAFSKTISGFR